MTSPNRDVNEAIEAGKAKIEKIKRDPERALFSNFAGKSGSRAVTVEVDLMGRLKRIHIEPDTLYEGAESWIATEISAAYEAARKAADFLDFDLASFASELENAPTVQQRLTDKVEREREEREKQAVDDEDDDDYFRRPLGR
ncbi:YbaB/EbfC family nucleoid-associated protein [Haloechinothrix sp. LS1_15]|uniref:YbaB/EbfC family nucleoid-associated protein n=1 Tax=Haloechinothrix sp. LS1_15 TaxID=2652248 RepID=UPI00294AC642|nr:YbaB/EbfC family nucleoid-associated protein [Haloechinothrix sp. LS1_15]